MTLADSRQIEAPRIRPIEIAFANRTYATEALVLGDEALMGVLPIEAMDLVIDPRSQSVTVNPEHPNFPVTYAKGLALRVGFALPRREVSAIGCSGSCSRYPP